MADRLSDLLNGENPRKPPPTPAPPKEPANAEAEDQEQKDERRSYGYVRGIRDRVFAVDFQLLPRNAFPDENPAGDYVLLRYRAWLRDGSGFRLEYLNGLRVTVTGVRLRPLYDLVLQHRVYRITEQGDDPVGVEEDGLEPWVESILVERSQEEGEGVTERPEPSRRRSSQVISEGRDLLDA